MILLMVVDKRHEKYVHSSQPFYPSGYSSPLSTSSKHRVTFKLCTKVIDYSSVSIPASWNPSALEIDQGSPLNYVYMLLKGFDVVWTFFWSFSHKARLSAMKTDGINIQDADVVFIKGFTLILHSAVSYTSKETLKFTFALSWRTLVKTAWLHLVPDEKTLSAWESLMNSVFIEWKTMKDHAIPKHHPIRI